MFRSLLLGISTGFKSLVRNKAMTVASIISIFLSIFIFGVTFCIILNLNNMTNVVTSNYNSLQVFLKDDFSYADKMRFGLDIEKIPNVKEVIFESKEDAMKKFKKRLGKDSGILDGIDVTLQDSYIVHISDIDKVEETVNKISSNEMTDDISYHKDTMEKLSSFSKSIYKFGLFLMIFLMCISLFIIITTIKITMYSREKEIAVMRYIGASDTYIRIPFVVEGVIIGFFGSVLSYSFIMIIYNIIYGMYVSENIFFKLYILSPLSISSEILFIFFALGIGIGIVGSFFSIGRYMKV